MGKTILVKTFSDACKDAEKRFVKAGVNTVNIIAAVSKKNATRLIQNKFITRSNFTVKSLHFDQCPKSVTVLSDIKSEFGILKQAGYMERQETGGNKRSPTGNNLIIPTTAARGGNNERKVKGAFRYNKVRENNIPRRSPSSKDLAIAAYYAAKNKGFIHVKNFIYKVSKFRPKSGSLFKATPILNMSRDKTYTPPKPWLEPASDYAARLMQQIFNQQMDKLNS